MIRCEREKVVVVAIVWIHSGSVGGMIQNAVLDVIGHIRDAKLSNMLRTSTPKTHPLAVLRITPIEILVTIVNISSPLRSTPSSLCIQYRIRRLLLHPHLVGLILFQCRGDLINGWRCGPKRQRGANRGPRVVQTN